VNEETSPEKKKADENKEMELINLMLRKSFFFPAAEIYAGSLGGFWDFGPFGRAVREKVIDFWRKQLVKREGFLEIKGSEILPEQVFVASGHLKNFNDPLTQCSKCHALMRADTLISDHLSVNFPEGLPTTHFDELIKKHNLKCPKCGSELFPVKRFNLMLKTEVGVAGGQPAYLRPEACQNIFLDFSRLYKTMRITLPIGIAQPGNAFRNEINPRNYLLREREIGQMEIEIFFNPKKINEVNEGKWNEVKDYKLNLLLLNKESIEGVSCSEAVEKNICSGKLIAYYLAKTQQFYAALGIPVELFRFRQLSDDEKAFYAKETWDSEVLLGSKWLELMACNYRTDHDLKGHSVESKKDLSVAEGEETFIPHIFELSAGIDRAMYAALYFAYKVDTSRGEKSVYLDLKPFLAPVSVGILPLVNKDGLNELAKGIYNELTDEGFDAFFDDSGSIGRRYARLDEIGCPFAFTIDYKSKEDSTVTIRERNSMQQKRISIKEIPGLLRQLISMKKDFTQI
jgi:glycyl-tRNA synthetase